MRLESGTVIEAARLAFDMDGTLIDSTGLIEKAWVHWAKHHHLDVTDILQACHGRRAIETVARFAVPGMDIEAEAAQVADFVDRRLDELKPAPGAMELLQSLSPADWGLVTSAQRSIAERWMRHLEFPVPSVLIAAEDVVAGKPHPMPYIAAARALGCRTEEMVVFEDSVAGLTSAEMAGAHVIAVGQHSEGYGRWLPDFVDLRFAEGRLHIR
ncbi:HAD-IA family hydrolase [Devosia albogilva]|uniref:HAD-IA family hydrolase n=1 Tax=Devosia albogilva TaxID=429726 RepID=A0ABW5QHX6_9HYPH